MGKPISVECVLRDGAGRSAPARGGKKIIQQTSDSINTERDQEDRETKERRKEEACQEPETWRIRGIQRSRR
jgi:hypothetical protein